MKSSWQNWYQKNKDSLAEKRKKRYDSDPGYRAKQLLNAANARATKKKLKQPDKTTPETHPYTLVEAGNVLGRSPATLREWHRNGYYPRPRVYRRRFVFNPAQMTMLGTLRDWLAAHGTKTSVHSQEFENLKAFISVNWV